MLYSFITFGGNEVQSLVDVSDFVKTHFAAVRLGQGLAWDDLKQQHKFQAIAEIFFDVFDASASLPQVAVAPCCEGLKWDSEKYFSSKIIRFMQWLNFLISDIIV